MHEIEQLSASSQQPAASLSSMEPTDTLTDTHMDGNWTDSDPPMHVVPQPHNLQRSAALYLLTFKEKYKLTQIAVNFAVLGVNFFHNYRQW